MSKKISKDDIIESGLFDDAIKSADLFLNKARELESQLKSNLEISREYFSNAQIEGSKSIKDLNAETVKVNATLAEYEKTQFAVLDIEKKQAQLKQELAKAQKEELKLTQELAKEEAKRLKQTQTQTGEYKKSSDALRELKKQLKDLSIAGKQNTKEYTDLNKQFVELDKKVRAADASVGDFQRNVGNYPKQLKEMQKALMDLEPGTDEFIRLSKEAGELKDKINDSKDATKAFAAGAKTTQAKTIFGQVTADLGDLDFQGASEKAKTFANVVKSISFTEIVSGLKSFGAAILDVGKALLTNPFTIIAAAISGLIYITYDLVTSFTSLAETTKTVNEALEASQKRIDELGKRQLDYLLRIKIAQGQLTKEQGELVKTDLKNLDERKQAQKKFSDDIIKLATELEVDLSELKGKRFKEDDIAITLTGKKELEKRKRFNRELAKIEKKYATEYALLIKTQSSEITAIKTEQQKSELDKLKKHEKKKVGVISGATIEAQNIQLKNIEEKQDAELVGLENEKKNNEKFLEDVLANSKKNDEKRAKLRDEEIDRAAQTSVKMLTIFENELKEKQRLAEEGYNKEIADREAAIDIQRRLAEAGKANTLAFEEAEKARLEREREEEKKKEIKRQKAIAFFKAYASYVEKDPNTALTNAIRDTVLAETIAGAFFEGSEKIENDLSPAFNTGKDDYLVRVDGQERVLTGEQNKLVGNMSNDELAKLAFAHQNGFIKAGATPDVFAENIKQSATLMQLINVTKELQEIKNVIYNKPETSFEFDKYGDYIKTTIEKGFLTREKFKTPKPRI
jgi:hypothetical protein